MRVGRGRKGGLTSWPQKPIWKNIWPLAFAREPKDILHPTSLPFPRENNYRRKGGTATPRSNSHTQNTNIQTTQVLQGWRIDFPGVLSFQLGKTSHHFWLHFYASAREHRVNTEQKHWHLPCIN